MIIKMEPTKHKVVAKPIHELITQAEYARRKGVSRTAVCKHVKSRKITLVNGKVDPVMADQQLKANLDISQKRKVKLSDDVGNELSQYQEARARREKAKASLAELELAEKEGLLICVAQVEKEEEDLYRQYRDRMLNVVIRATKKLLGETNEFKFRKTLKKEIEHAIKKICNELSGRTVGH